MDAHHTNKPYHTGLQLSVICYSKKKNRCFWNHTHLATRHLKEWKATESPKILKYVFSIIQKTDPFIQNGWRSAYFQGPVHKTDTITSVLNECCWFKVFSHHQALCYNKFLLCLLLGLSSAVWQVIVALVSVDLV